MNILKTSAAFLLLLISLHSLAGRKECDLSRPNVHFYMPAEPVQRVAVGDAIGGWLPTANFEPRGGQGRTDASNSLYSYGVNCEKITVMTGTNAISGNNFRSVGYYLFETNRDLVNEKGVDIELSIRGNSYVELRNDEPIQFAEVEFDNNRYVKFYAKITNGRNSRLISVYATAIDPDSKIQSKFLAIANLEWDQSGNDIDIQLRWGLDPHSTNRVQVSFLGYDPYFSENYIPYLLSSASMNFGSRFSTIKSVRAGSIQATNAFVDGVTPKIAVTIGSIRMVPN